MNQQLDFFGSTSAIISIQGLIANLAIGFLLAIALRWHYLKFGSTLTNRREFAQVFPFILLTTVLIISIVKSSLALSLGLVGALSIVRFRTPIKEPEELAYLFIAIAMGLGLGASQTLATVVASFAILTSVAVLRWRQTGREHSNLFLSVECSFDSDEAADGHLDRLNELISNHASSSDLRRFDIRESVLEASYVLEVPSVTNLGAIANDLRAEFSNISVTFLDQNQLPSI